MIRGVSRYTVEIGRTGSPYFERAICFVRPEYTRCDKVDLHKAAQKMISALDAGVESAGNDKCTSGANDTKRQFPPWLWLVISALAGAAVSLLLCLIII